MTVVDPAGTGTAAGTGTGTADDAAVLLPEVRGLPGWALRLALLVLALGLVAAAVDPHALPPAVWIVGGVVALATALFPGSPAAVLLLGLTAAAQVLTDGVGLDIRLVLTAVLLDVVHVLSALTAVVPLAARVDPRALAASGRRFLVVLGLSVPVLAADGLVSGGTASGPLFLATAVAALAVVVVALRLGGRSR